MTTGQALGEDRGFEPWSSWLDTSTGCFVRSLRVLGDSGVNETRSLDLFLRQFALLRRREAVAGAQQNLKLIDPLQKRAGLLRRARHGVVGLDVHRVGVRVQSGRGG